MHVMWWLLAFGSLVDSDDTLMKQWTISTPHLSSVVSQSCDAHTRYRSFWTKCEVAFSKVAERGAMKASVFPS